LDKVVSLTEMVTIPGSEQALEPQEINDKKVF